MTESFSQSNPMAILRALNERELRWLWTYMIRTGFELPEERRIQPSQHAAHIIAAINNKPRGKGVTLDDVVHALVGARKDHVVDGAHFKWLEKDNDRPAVWMLSQVETSPDPLTMQTPFTPAINKGLNWLESVILTVDSMNTTPAEKISFLTHKKQEWALARTKDRQTKWINPKNAIQVRWAWDYLTKHHKAINLPHPVMENEYFTAVLASLDAMFYMHPAEKTLFIEGMKKTWSQKKYRDSGKAKKQKYMPLTMDTRGKLERLANLRGEKEHEVVEALIQEAFLQISGS